MADAEETSEKSSEGNPLDDDERTICFCHNVNQGKIREAMKKGAKTLEDVQDATSACTGCGGCEFDVIELLEKDAESK